MERQYSIDADPHVTAAKFGCVYVPADEFTLQLDIDSLESLHNHRKNLDVLDDFLPKGWREPIKDGIPSRSGGAYNMHITIKLTEPMSSWKRIALQAILGSDLTREAFNFLRVDAEIEEPIGFFEPKKKGGE